MFDKLHTEVNACVILFQNQFQFNLGSRSPAQVIYKIILLLLFLISYQAGRYKIQSRGKTMLSSPRILIVEDDDDSCQLITHLLRQANNRYQIFTAPTTQKALSLINTQPFDLYVLDYGLPKMTGLEVCSRIRIRDLITPVIFFSGMARLTDMNLAMAAGATEYLAKPNDLKKISDTVKRLLNNKDYKLTTKCFTYPSDTIW
jgi:CheY-like chemotaxis protein